MRRRDFIAVMGAAATWPLAATAQRGALVQRVGVLMNTVKDDPEGEADMAALRQALAERGWVEGRTIDIAVRWPGSNIELVDALAKELVGLKPDVLLSRSTPTTAALRKESRIIPIVFVNVAEPVEQGFVQSLARPGENITGFSNVEASVGSKMLGLLKEIDRRIVRVLAIYNPRTAPFAELYVRPLQSVAASLGVEITVVPVQNDSDITTAMTNFARQPGSGFVAVPDSFTVVHRDLIITLASHMRLPAIYRNSNFPRSGGLMAYAVDPRDLMRRAAGYVDRILRGDRPADLPVQQPTKFQLAINMKTAKALGLEIPPTLLAIADEVIE